MSKYASQYLASVGLQICEIVKRRPATKRSLVRRTGTSPMTIQRAMTWLREVGAPLLFDPVTKLWRMDGSWTLPAELVSREELLDAWVQFQELRRILEADDVVAEVLALVLDELNDGRGIERRRGGTQGSGGNVTRRQTRRTLSMSGLGYQRVKAYCDREGLSVAGYIEKLAMDDLDAKGEPTPTILCRRPKRKATTEEIVAQHFTF